MCQRARGASPTIAPRPIVSEKAEAGNAADVQCRRRRCAFVRAADYRGYPIPMGSSHPCTVSLPRCSLPSLSSPLLSLSLAPTLGCGALPLQSPLFLDVFPPLEMLHRPRRLLYLFGRACGSSMGSRRGSVDSGEGPCVRGFALFVGVWPGRLFLICWGGVRYLRMVLFVFDLGGVEGRSPPNPNPVPCASAMLMSLDAT